MPKFKVTYEHEVVYTSQGYVEANSLEEAKQKVHDVDLLEEEVIDYQGMEIRILEIEEEK